MVVQASLAEDLVAHDSDAAAVAMREVQRSGRDALAETGRLVRLIRDDDELGMQPQHGIAEIEALVEDYARAGLEVDVVVDPALTALPMGVGLSTYRIVQEALTNALKHAPGSRVSVRVGGRAGEVSIAVENDAARDEAGERLAHGYGLVGVRERVALFGGTMHAAPTDAGGFSLVATLPFSLPAA
jgi:signal transduction histidine kinase